MSFKIQLRVFVNSDIAHLVWQIEKRIPHLLGFAIEKRTHDEHNKVTNEDYLKSWIGFPGRQEKVGEHRPTTQWPIQEFQWSDHTCLYNERVSYRVIPVIGTTPDDLKPNMAGASDWSTPQTLNGRLTSGACFEAYFNRGIVASQWLNILLDKMNAKHPASALDKLIADPSDHTRKYLGGSLRHAMLDLLAQVHKSAGTKVHLCLYELDDPELMDHLKKLGKKAHVLLANGTHTPEEPDENARSRQELRSSGVNVYDRIITASGVLAHNKFVVFTEGDKATMAWTGSTNWTKSGLCTQCNNGLLIRDERLASIYLAEWHHLKSLEGETGKDLRKFNESLSEKASITIQEPGSGPVTIQQWFSPITGESDLEEARKLIANAQHGILFLMFNPGPTGTLYNAIIDVAKDPHKNLHIEGVINQDPSTQTHPVELLHRGHIDSVTDADVVLPAAMDGFPDHWVKELKMKRGAHAMIHSKCIVIDPFTENPVVITGSHNMGPKASKLNDDNMVIIRGSKALAHAYAVNVMAIYIHYRWRYHSNFEAPGAHAFSSLSLKDGWQDPFLTAGTEKRRELQFWFGQPFGKAGRTPQAIQHINGDADVSGLAQAVEELSISEKDGGEKKSRRRAQKKREEEEEEDEDEDDEKPAPRRRAHKAERESKVKPARAVRGRRGDDDAYHPDRDDGEDIEGDEDEDYEPEEPVRRKAGGARKKNEGEAEKKPRRKVGAARRKKDEYEDEDEDEDDDYESEPEKTTRRKAAPRRKADVAPVARPQVMSGGGGQRNESSEGCVMM